MPPTQEKIDQAFELINDDVYKAVALKAMEGNLAAVRALAVLDENRRKLARLKLRKQLFGV